MGRRGIPIPAVAAVVAVAVTGCGSSRTAESTTTKTTPISTSRATTTAATTTASAPPSSPPLQAEAASAATGDIPDNQVFLVFRNQAGGYMIRYPEGWAEQSAATRVVFHDKNNIVRIVRGRGKLPSLAAVRKDLAADRGVTVTGPPVPISIGAGPALKVVYRTLSSPNPVTGKRVTLAVDRYYLANGNRTAVVDLGTPIGVDNVDAYRLMISSFRWR